MSSFVNDAWDKMSHKKEFYVNEKSQKIFSIVYLIVCISVLFSGIYALVDALNGKTYLQKIRNLFFAFFFTPLYLAVRLHQETK